MRHECENHLPRKAQQAFRAGQPIKPVPNEQRMKSSDNVVLYSPQPKVHDYVPWDSPAKAQEMDDQDQQIIRHMEGEDIGEGGDDQHELEAARHGDSAQW